MCALKSVAIWHYDLDGPRKLLAWYVREAITYFLIWGIKYCIIRNPLPIVKPGATKGAVAIENKNWALWNLLNHTGLAPGAVPGAFVVPFGSGSEISASWHEVLTNGMFVQSHAEPGAIGDSDPSMIHNRGCRVFLDQR